MRGSLAIVAAALTASVLAGPAHAQGLVVGEQAVLFESVDETLSPLDMADLIDGRPLVLVTGSAT